jgi:hypothetical protein
MQTYLMSDPYIAEKLTELSGIPSKVILAWVYEESGKIQNGLLLVPRDADSRDFVAADEDAANKLSLVLLELPALYRERICQIQMKCFLGSEHNDKAPPKDKKP